MEWGCWVGHRIMVHSGEPGWGSHSRTMAGHQAGFDWWGHHCHLLGEQSPAAETTTTTTIPNHRPLTPSGTPSKNCTLDPLETWTCWPTPSLFFMLLTPDWETGLVAWWAARVMCPYPSCKGSWEREHLAFSFSWVGDRLFPSKDHWERHS